MVSCIKGSNTNKRDPMCVKSSMYVYTIHVLFILILNLKRFQCSKNFFFVICSFCIIRVRPTLKETRGFVDHLYEKKETTIFRKAVLLPFYDYLRKVSGKIYKSRILRDLIYRLSVKRSN